MNAARRSSLLCPRVLQIASQPWDSSLVESVGRLLLSSIANSAPTGESMQYGNVSDLTGTAKRQPSPQQYGPPTAASTPSRRAGVSARPGLKKAFPRWPGGIWNPPRSRVNSIFGIYDTSGPPVRSLDEIQIMGRASRTQPEARQALPTKSSTAITPDRRPLWVKPGKAPSEHMFSGLPPIATDTRTSWIGSLVP